MFNNDSARLFNIAVIVSVNAIQNRPIDTAASNAILSLPLNITICGHTGVSGFKVMDVFIDEHKLVDFYNYNLARFMELYLLPSDRVLLTESLHCDILTTSRVCRVSSADNTDRTVLVPRAVWTAGMIKCDTYTTLDTNMYVFNSRQEWLLFVQWVFVSRRFSNYLVAVRNNDTIRSRAARDITDVPIHQQNTSDTKSFWFKNLCYSG